MTRASTYGTLPSFIKHGKGIACCRFGSQKIIPNWFGWCLLLRGCLKVRMINVGFRLGIKN